MSAFGLIIPAILAYWVYTDASSRGMSAIGWSIFTFFIWIIALPVYLFMRLPKIADSATDDVLDHLVDDETV